MVYTDGYQPYGQDNGTPTGSFKNRATDKFTGKPYSTSTGLYYEYQRWYDPSIGRFISPDPLVVGLSDPQSLNRYVYASNIPTSETDPSGLRMIAGPGIFRYGKPCPSMFQDFFGSFACSFGITQVGGGYYAPDLSTGAISSEDQGEGGLLVYAGVLGAVGLIDLGVFISDSLNPSKPGRVSPPKGSDGGGNGSDGGSGTGPIIKLPGSGTIFPTGTSTSIDSLRFNFQRRPNAMLGFDSNGFANLARRHRLPLFYACVGFGIVGGLITLGSIAYSVANQSPGLQKEIENDVADLSGVLVIGITCMGLVIAAT